MRKKARKLSKAELLNRQIASWERKQEDATVMLRRSAEQLVKLRRKRQRMLARETKALTARDVVWPSGEPVKSGDIEPGSVVEIEVGTGVVTAIEPPADDLTVSIHAALAENRRQHDRHSNEDIPTFLDRTAGNDKDAAARAEIEAQQAAQKKAKAERRIKKLKIGQETKHAELTGQRRKMPLTGKDALAAIRTK